jgi:cell division transport system permease protein
MLDRIEFLLSEAFVALRRNGLMTFAAMTTVAVSLFLIGSMGYVYYRVNEFAGTLPGRFEMRVFLKDGVKQPEISNTANEIRKMEGVNKVFWIPKEVAWEKWKKESPHWTEGLDNPLPDALKVTVKDLSHGDRLQKDIQAMDTVAPDGVQYLKEEQNFVDQMLRVVKWIGIVFGGLLFLTGGVLIYNAIQLTIVNRRLEVRIMNLVGAPPIMVQVPFIIEGAVQGLVGGIIASFMVLGANQMVFNFVRTLREDATPVHFPVLTFLLILGGIGTIYGAGCSLLAIKPQTSLRLRPRFRSR